jgi:hypothetical protein
LRQGEYAQSRTDRAGRKDGGAVSTIDNKTITETVTLGSVDSFPTYDRLVMS